MDKEIKNIGGEFSLTSIFPFVVKADSLKQELFFPKILNNKSRILVETGTDAICLSIINYFTEINSKIIVWFPFHYCGITINRVISILEHKNVHFEIKYYPLITKDLIEEFSSKDILVYMHFNHFERLDDYILNIKNKKNFFLLEDFVLAPFDIKMAKGDVAFNSLRKISPLSISLMYSNQDNISSLNIYPSEYARERKAASLIKAVYEMSFYPDLERSYLIGFENADKILSAKTEISSPQNEDMEIMDRIDWEGILQKRRNNYQVLRGSLNQINESILPGDSQYLMIKIQNRDVVRKGLFAERIFAAIHWVDSASELAGFQLSLPIDQRYSNDDMNRLGDCVLRNLNL